MQGTPYTTYTHPQYVDPVNNQLLYDTLPLQRFADLHGMSFIEASARHNLYVAEVFRSLAEQMCELKMQRQPLPYKNNDPLISIVPLPPHNGNDHSNKGSNCSC